MNTQTYFVEYARRIGRRIVWFRLKDFQSTTKREAMRVARFRQAHYCATRVRIAVAKTSYIAV